MFMTEQREKPVFEDPTSGQLLDDEDADSTESFRLQDHIPISHTDVHRFVAEIS